MTAKPKTTQADPTAPRPTDENGRTLDQWGLPLAGPARAAALDAAGKPDPRDDADAWAAPAVPATASTSTD